MLISDKLWHSLWPPYWLEAENSIPGPANNVILASWLGFDENGENSAVRKGTFMRKNVILVRRSTVDLRSMSFSWLEAGKLLRYIDKSIRSELCNWSKSLTNFSFCSAKKNEINGSAKETSHCTLISETKSDDQKVRIKLRVVPLHLSRWIYLRLLKCRPCGGKLGDTDWYIGLSTGYTTTWAELGYIYSVKLSTRYVTQLCPMEQRRPLAARSQA